MPRLFRSVVPMLMIVILLTIATPPNIQANPRWSWNRRRSVVLEAFYAMRIDHTGGCGQYTCDKCFGNWNYLAENFATLDLVKSWYGWDASVKLQFYDNPSAYGYSDLGGECGYVARGGQCKFFANLVLYRSGSHLDRLPSYSTMWSNSEGNLNTVKEGDIIITRYWLTATGVDHTAVVVEVKRDWYGNVYALDVIDSNFVSDLGYTANREVIARHQFAISDIRGKYRIWKGSWYYAQSYDPNA